MAATNPAVVREVKQMVAVPDTVESITPAWLTSALQSSGTASEARVTHLDKEPTGEGQGLGGAVLRLTVSYDRDDDSLPGSLVAKIHHADPARRMASSRFGQYERERRFYADIAADIGIRVPKCYYVGHDPTTGYFVALMEDLGDLREVDQADDCSLADAEAAVDVLVDLHSRWWGDTRLEQWPWILDPGDLKSSTLARDRYLSSVDGFLELVGDHLPSGVEEIVRSLGRNFVRVMAATARAPITLNHGDFRVGNLLYDDQADGNDRVVTFDWPAICRRRGPGDLAYFICVGFTTASRLEHEPGLLDRYYTGIGERGIQGYSREEFTSDYRIALLRNLTNFVPGVASAGDAVLSIPMGRKRVIAMCERFQTLLDWDSGSAIEETAVST